MRHPTEGVLRRLLDEPAGVADPDRQHVAGCAHCLSELVVIREDARLVGAALPGGKHADVDAAWRRLSAAAAGAAPARATARPGSSRARNLLHRPAAAVLAVALVVTGASAAAANDWLQIFRTEKIAPISFTTADLLALPDLSAYGDLAVTEEPGVHAVQDAATAAAETGLDVPQVSDLPSGISGDPVHQVGSQVSATFTFSTARATGAAAEAGKALPPPPGGLDGSQLRLVAGPGVAQVWASASGVPALVVGRAVAPRAFSSGLPFATARDYLLSLPGLPDDVAAQLRTFTADGETLPLPVPADLASTRSAQVNGTPATLLTAHDRSFAAVVWVEDDLLTVVAGSLDDDEVLAVARGLR